MKLLMPVLSFLVCASLHAEAKSTRSLFLEAEVFKNIPNTSQAEYIKQIKKAYLEFEKALPDQKFSLHEEASGQPANALLSILMQAAFAAGNEKCLIGGVERPKINGLCSTVNNACQDQPQSFRCGVVFGSICISRTPINSISERCFKQSALVPIAPEKFNEYVTNIVELKDKYCKSGAPPHACKRFEERASTLKENYEKDVLKRRADQMDAQRERAIRDAAAAVSQTTRPAVSATPTVAPATSSTTTVPAGDEATAKCKMQLRRFDETLIDSLDRQAGRAKLQSAYLDSRDLWSEYQKLKASCKSEDCKLAATSAIFEQEMNPAEADSVNGIADGFKQDLNVLGVVLNMTAAKPKSERKKTDLDALIAKLGWDRKSRFSETLIAAYMEDETFSEPSRNKRLISLTASLGKGRFFRSQEDYTAWLNNGHTQLNRDKERLDFLLEKFKDGAGTEGRMAASTATANSEEVKAALKMKELVTKAQEVGQRLRTALSHMSNSLSDLGAASPECLKTSGVLTNLAQYSDSKIEKPAPTAVQPNVRGDY